MINTAHTFVYKAFGYTISSEIPLPELPSIKLEDYLSDITVKRLDLINLWSELSSENDYFVINENQIVFQIPEIAIFLIRNGNEICFSPFVDIRDKHLRLYILGTCMGAILMQRKILPLHGSAIAINGKAYAIVGESGAGKSTLASAFLQKGYQLLSDDVIPVTFSSNDTPIVTPAYPQQKLWIESLNQFEMNADDYQSIVERETKFAVPVFSQFARESLPLGGIFELIISEDERIELLPIKKMERFLTVYQHTYRNFFIEDSGLMDWHFNTSAKFVNKINLYQLSRPQSRFTAHELADCVLTTIEKEVSYLKN
ncbi:phosphoenolpyruvate carboxykinase (ATP) [Bacillus cihuensis]|uniref:aldolase n=1 Tax=Bacillus cihuensis TaxID=1208599 RepID=UPI0003F63356|nr:aldolase [Bacillus cihuensis]